MDIPMNARVTCLDGTEGRVICLIVDPVHWSVTHFAMRTKGLVHLDYLVPVSWISASDHKSVRLTCTREELTSCAPFTRAAFVGGDEADDASMAYLASLAADEAMMWPYRAGLEDLGGEYVTVEELPPDELGLHRGASVRATDGPVGVVEEFVVNPGSGPGSGRITHLVLREGHVWGKREITIPVEQIAGIDDDEVRLKLDRAAIGALPAVPAKRWRDMASDPGLAPDRANESTGS